MTLAVSLLTIAVFLSGATIGVIALIVLGIRSDDRSKNLTSNPRTHVQAATRRMLGVGVRTSGFREAKEEPAADE